jgi:hypothetical protein
MFIIYFNLIALAAVASRDEADDYIRETMTIMAVSDTEFMVDYVQEDEDLWYSINS